MLQKPWLPAAILVAGTVAGLLWGNLAGHGYHEFWSQPAPLRLGWFEVDLTLHGWVNDALMTFFFLRAGVEIKRELVRGELRSPRAAALPVVAALGGMLVPILVYLLVTSGGGCRDGWAVPVATDVAFALGVLALAGRRVPAHLKLFLLTLAIADDVGGILIIAIVFTDSLSWVALACAGCCVLGVFAMRAVRIEHPLAYVPVCALMWYCTLQSGVHPTIAGVVAGVLVPGVPMRGIDVIARVHKGLKPLVVLVVFPLFAVANTGITLNGEFSEALGGSVFWGIGLGLVLGKTVGITLFAWGALACRLGQLPHGVERRHLPAVGMFGGIGFTVSLFLADLSFASQSLLGEAKIAILCASAAASLAGLAILWRVSCSPSASGPLDSPVSKAMVTSLVRSSGPGSGHRRDRRPG